MALTRSDGHEHNVLLRVNAPLPVVDYDVVQLQALQACGLNKRAWEVALQFEKAMQLPVPQPKACKGAEPAVYIRKAAVARL